MFVQIIGAVVDSILGANQPTYKMDRLDVFIYNRKQILQQTGD